MKTKTMKRLAAAVAAITMMSAVPMIGVSPVIADASTLKVTSVDGVVHTYEAYQILSGDVSGDTLSNVSWGSAVVQNSDTTYNVSDDIYGVLNLTQSGDKTLEKAIDAIKNTADIQSLSKALYEKVKGKTNTTITSGDSGATVSDGYYLLIDKTASGYAALSANLMKVAGDVTLNPKMSKPTIDKKIIDNNNPVDANTQTIGKKVTYQLTTVVPDMTGYDKYFYIVNDNLSPGLELDVNSFSVTIKKDENKENDADISVPYNKDASTKYGLDTGFYVETYQEKIKDDGGDDASNKYDNAFRLVFNNMKSHQNEAGKTMIITYEAWLGGNNSRVADKVSYETTGTSANINAANLVYSNNPNFSYEGKGTSADSTNSTPEKPYEPPMSDVPNVNPSTPNNPLDDVPTDNDLPTNKTTEDKVFTYTASLKITKTKEGGAAFTAGEVGFTVKDSAGNKVLDEVKNTGTSTSEEIVFSGLGAGTYTIEETTVPNGFNKAPVYTLVIEADPTDSTGSKCKWTVGTSSSSGIFTVDTANYASEYKASIVNNKGSVLPSTGGIGTTIFYVSGGVLVLGAGVVLITKKRMSAKEDK